MDKHNVVLKQAQEIDSIVRRGLITKSKITKAVIDDIHRWFISRGCPAHSVLRDSKLHISKMRGGIKPNQCLIYTFMWLGVDDIYKYINEDRGSIGRELFNVFKAGLRF